jgi:Tfp pilus assembly protein PilF
MMGNPRTRPPGTAHRPSSTELRIGNLRRELDAECDPTIQAAILYHVGSLYEHELRSPSEALEHYRRARQAAPHFQPAAMAEVRIEERSRRGDALAPLLREQVAAAREPAVRASALLDLALCSNDWAHLLREAIEEALEPAVPALVLEWLAEAHHEPDSLRDALRAQAECASEPALRAALWLDCALAEIESGEVDVAIQALELAAQYPGIAWSARVLQRRTAEEHERWDAWVAASAAMARLLESDAPLDPLDLSVPMEEHLPLAALLWQEAAMVSVDKLADLDAGANYLASALRLSPDDEELRRESLMLADARRDPEALASAKAWFARAAPRNPAFVSYQIDRALSTEDDPASLNRLREIAASHPDSVYAQTAFDVLLTRAGIVDERVDRLQSRAADVEGERRALLLWRAARLLAGGDTPEAAQALFVESADCSQELKPIILRDALRAAIEGRQGDAVVARAGELLEMDLDREEHALIAFCRYEVSQRTLADPAHAKALLIEATQDERNLMWAPHIARARGELDGDGALLAVAHEALAELARPEGRVEHLLCAGRAHAQQHDWSSAERVLREALDLSPSDRRVLDLLEEVLRDGGRPEAIVTLARSRAGGHLEGAHRELSLLRAGATAERTGDLQSARRAYEEALRQLPESASAALALADIGRRQQDADTLRAAYQTLSTIELGGGVPELCALQLGDAIRRFGGDSDEASRAYESALEHPVTAVASATALLSLPVAHSSEDQRAAAEEILTDAGAALGLPPDGFSVAYEALGSALGRTGSTAGDAWLELARLAPSDVLRAGALLQGLRELRIAKGEDALDDLFILAQSSEDLAVLHPEAAIAIDEVLAPGDDPELRASALEHKLQHSTSLGRAALDAAHCRALVEADRGAEAVALLSETIDSRPDDLTLWETMRGAARQAGEWSLVAQACERLAPFVGGDLRADLLEEAAAVRLDCLDQQQQAEELFRAALEADPTRDVAFRRLHDLLADREDAEALEALVTNRLAIGGTKERPDLLYERARLLRGFSDRPGALEVLGELFATEPEHAGALALAAEVHVSLERWEEAVDCLRRLSRANIPKEQRRIAHLGAADFLENRLGRLEEALTELRAVEDLGFEDVETQLRIGSLEEGFDNTKAAIAAYRRVLDQQPTHTAAAERLASLIEGEERARVVSQHEKALWDRVTQGYLDAPLLGSLRQAAHWRGSLERAAAIAAVESALDHEASSSEGATDLSHVSIASLWDRKAEATIAEVIRRAGPALAANRIRSKRLVPDAPAYAELERLTERFGARFGSAAASDSIEQVYAQLGRDDEVHWTVPSSARKGLDASTRFTAGRLAWAVPRGGGALVDVSPQSAAGHLAGILIAARCQVADGGPVLPAVPVKLRRAVRKSVREAVGNASIDAGALLVAARRFQRSADRAGLLAAGDAAAALRVLVGDPLSMTALRSSERGIDLLRFWCAPESPLWGDDD